MTKTQMPDRPEPDGYLTVRMVGREVDINAYRDSTMRAYAEAYANARVRVALEIALAEAKRVSDKYGYGYYGSEVDAVDEVAEAIRALIQPTKNEAEE